MKATVPVPPNQNHFGTTMGGANHIPVPTIHTTRQRPRRGDAASKKEGVLRKELNNLAERGHRHYQFAVTLLVTLSTALFFVRKEAAERAGLLPGEPFPFERHRWGTIVLAIVALILAFIAWAIYSSYLHFARQMPPVLVCGVRWLPRRSVRWILIATLGTFPLFDAYVGWANAHFPLRHDPAYHMPGSRVALPRKGRSLPTNPALTRQRTTKTIDRVKPPSRASRPRNQSN